MKISNIEDGIYIGKWSVEKEVVFETIVKKPANTLCLGTLGHGMNSSQNLMIKMLEQECEKKGTSVLLFDCKGVKKHR